MGISGTDVAKGAAGILLLDDNFSTIRTAINDGRKITRNIKNVISFILSTNIATALFIVTFTYIFGMNPITISQRLLLDLITDTLPCIYIGLNPNDFNIMSKNNKNSKMFSKQTVIEILVNSLSLAIISSCAFVFSYSLLDIRNDNYLSAISFVTLSLGRILLSFNYVDESRSLFSKEGKAYKNIVFAVCISICLLSMMVLIPGVDNAIIKFNF